MNIVFGIVEKDRNVLVGEKTFTVKTRKSDKEWEGDKRNIYDITFTPPFTHTPVIVVTAEHAFDGNEDKMFGPYIDKIDKKDDRLEGFTVIVMKLQSDEVNAGDKHYARKDENRFHFTAISE